MVNEELVNHVKSLSKHNSTQKIRTILYKKYDRAEVDEAIQFYIDNFVAKQVKKSNDQEPTDVLSRHSNPVALFFLQLVLFRGLLPPLIVFGVLFWFFIKYSINALFPSDPRLFWFFYIAGFVVFFFQGGIVYLLMTVFKGSEMVENTYSRALTTNIFIMLVGAFTFSFFLFSQTKTSIILLIAAPIIYIILISFSYTISIIRAFFMGILLAFANNLLNALIMFAAGSIFLGINVFTQAVP